MRVILDRSKCSRQPAACPVCFAGHLATGDFTSADCAMQSIENGRSEILFKIYERDGSIRSMVVNAENIAAVFDNWQLAWEVQAGPII
jgi:hypothetical protein